MEPNLQYWIDNPMLIRWIPKNNTELYSKLISIISANDLSIAGKLWCYYNGLTEAPKCPTCGKYTKFHTLKTGFLEYCSAKCSAINETTKNKRRFTCKSIYGVDNISQNIDIKKKVHHTMITKYGGVAQGSPIIKEKSKQTCLERYGVDHVSKIDGVSKKIRDTHQLLYGGIGFGSRQISEKITNNMIERYGVNHNMSSDLIKEKSKQTCLERYGVSNPFQVERFKEKSKQTCLERYGVKFASQSERIKDKISNTNIERYGFPNYNSSIRAHNDHIHKAQVRIENVIDICGDDYICSCTDMSCGLCDARIFMINKSTLKYRIDHDIELCPIKIPIGINNKSTSIENSIRRILDDVGVAYETNVRGIIENYELDLYIPSKNVAIECNGCYWHSDQFMDKNYHRNKLELARSKGIILLMFWEDQITNNYNAVKSIILSKLGIYDKKIYARRCRVKKLNNNQASDILSRHLQGPCKASVIYGLFYNDVLISVMSFGRRKINGSDVEWELLRYVCLPGYRIVGGASKLLKYFINHYNPKRLISFSSNDISDGNLYNALGFERIAESGSYWYIDKKLNRYHRYKYRKSELIKMGYDPNKTETQIMNELGFYRIWDSGQTKWIKTFQAS